MGSKTTCKEVKTKSAAAIKQAYAEIGVFADDNNVLNIAVYFPVNHPPITHPIINGAARVLNWGRNTSGSPEKVSLTTPCTLAMNVNNL